MTHPRIKAAEQAQTEVMIRGGMDNAAVAGTSEIPEWIGYVHVYPPVKM